MGQAASSCAPSIIFNGVVKVLLNDGSLEIYTRPVKAAELMLEHPGHFVCDSTHNLQVGHRVTGLLADEELERRRQIVYFILPMEMLYSVLTNEEMSVLNYKAAKALKTGNLRFSKIIFGDFRIFPNLNMMISSSSPSPSSTDKILRVRGGDDVGEVSTKSLSRQRSWTPGLETILETQ